MPKATVTIDMPDGWELAENEPRGPHAGEWYWMIGWAAPRQATTSLMISGSFIVRRVADQYVNVRLRREAAAHFTTLGKFNNPHGYHDHLVDACREALRERCGQPFWERPSYSTVLNCTRDRAHAGEHGV